eukprot:9943502-Alexandrium_andersonii.AAC.1
MWFPSNKEQMNAHWARVAVSGLRHLAHRPVISVVPPKGRLVSHFLEVKAVKLGSCLQNRA